jgi:hypothetical protein
MKNITNFSSTLFLAELRFWQKRNNKARRKFTRNNLPHHLFIWRWYSLQSCWFVTAVMVQCLHDSDFDYF